MDISCSNISNDYGIETPDVSFFVPSPVGSPACSRDRQARSGEKRISPVKSPAANLEHKLYQVLPVHVQPKRLRAFIDTGVREYSGLLLKRFTIHQGRFGTDEDSSLLEAVVQSGFDDNKAIRICAEGSESVHAFASALSEEFLNSSDAVQLRQVTVLSPDDVDKEYLCIIEAIYPAIPRFRHLSRTYLGIAKSDRSVLHASLSAACNMVGQILQTFQPEGYTLPDPPPPTPTGTPMVSTIDTVSECRLPEYPSTIRPESPKRRSFVGKLSSFFICNSSR